MFGIGGEKYSREKWDEAKQDAKSAEKAYQTTGTGRYGKGGMRSWPQSHYDELWREAEKAQGRLDELTQKGHKEAIKLNEEYDRLSLNVEEALRALHDFKVNKLGISEEKEEKEVG